MVSTSIGALKDVFLKNGIAVLFIAIVISVLAFAFHRYFFATKENFDDALPVPKEAADLLKSAGDLGVSGITTRKSQLPRILQMEGLCTGITEPTQIANVVVPTQFKSEGCGWYYFDDYDKTSFPAYGDSQGPLNPNMLKLAKGGQWYFKDDMETAQKKENQKRCRRIRTCQLADLYDTKCGWCESLGYGIPLEGRAAMYPDDDISYCQSDPILVVEKCPPMKIPNGKLEFDENGKQVEPEPIPPPICDPQEGLITKKCMLFLAENVGISIRSPVYRVLRGDPDGYLIPNTMPNRKFKIAFQILGFRAGLPYDPNIFETGQTKRSTVLSYFKKLKELSTRGLNQRTREVATFLVSEDGDFVTDISKETSTGPFSMEQLQIEFINAGGQEQGTLYPSDDNIDQWSGFTLKSIRKAFYKACSQDTQAPSEAVQAEALEKCLGIKRKKSDGLGPGGVAKNAAYLPTPEDIERQKAEAKAANEKSDKIGKIAVNANKAAAAAALAYKPPANPAGAVGSASNGGPAAIPAAGAPANPDAAPAAANGVAASASAAPTA